MTDPTGRPTKPNAAPSLPRSIARRLDRLVGRVAEARLSALAGAVRRERLTGLSPIKLRVIEASLRHVRRNDVPGDFLELGVALGGSAIVIAAQLGAARRFHGYDVFGMVPPSGCGDGETSGGIEISRDGARTDLYDCVRGAFDRFGLNVDGDRIALHRGRLEDTFDLDETHRLAFVHIDCDWYEPVRFCLSAICPRLSPGAFVVLDDYNDYGGCRRATDAFLENNPRFRLISSGPNGVLRYI